MRAYSTASGGVIFVSDKIEREKSKTSYADLVKSEPQKRRKNTHLFSKKTKRNAVPISRVA